MSEKELGKTSKQVCLVVPVSIFSRIDVMAGVDKANVPSEKIVELEWWECIKFARGESDDDPLEIIEKKHRRKNSLQVDAEMNEKDDNHCDKDEMVVTCAPAQHWCSRSPFDRNKRLWCSWAVQYIKSQQEQQNKSLNFYFAGDTGYPDTFPLHRQIGDFLVRNIALMEPASLP